MTKLLQVIYHLILRLQIIPMNGPFSHWKYFWIRLKFFKRGNYFGWPLKSLKSLKGLWNRRENLVHEIRIFPGLNCVFQYSSAGGFMIIFTPKKSNFRFLDHIFKIFKKFERFYFWYDDILSNFIFESITTLCVDVS